MHFKIVINDILTMHSVFFFVISNLQVAILKKSTPLVMLTKQAIQSYVAEARNEKALKS